MIGAGHSGDCLAWVDGIAAGLEKTRHDARHDRSPRADVPQGLARSRTGVQGGSSPARAKRVLLPICC